MTALGILAALLAVGLGAAPRPSVFASRTFGDVPLVWPAGAPTAAVVLLEGDGGWEKLSRDLADALAARGALVMGVDTKRYLQSRSGGCVYAAGDLEVLAQTVQKEAGLREYARPVLVGYSSGATLAYAALAQAPAGAFAGAASIGFCGDLPTRATLCKGESLARRTHAGREMLSPSPIRAPWKLYSGTRDRSCRLDAARTFAAAVPGAEVSAVDGAGHDYAVRDPPWTARVVADVIAMSAAAKPRVASEGPVSDLPLIESPAATRGTTLAVLVTGDGGWASIDRALAAQLTSAGIAVVALDALRYFWDRKTAEQLGADLRRIAAHYGSLWDRSDLVFVGYSRGADALPLGLAHAGDAVLARVRLLALVAPGLHAELEIHVADLFSGGARGEPLLPVLSALPAPLLCVYGAEEADESVCASLGGRPRTHVVALAGGHHFGGDYDAVGRLVIDELR